MDTIKENLVAQIRDLEESLKKKNFSLSNSVKYMRAILDLQSAIVFVLDNDEVIDGSQSFLYLFNYATTDEMQRDFAEAYIIEDSIKLPCPELLEEKEWVKYLLKNTSSTFRVKLIKDDIEYIFEILARNMLYRSGIPDKDYLENNYTVVSLNDITDLVKEMEKSREKDFMLMRQSRFATLGEMLANIAHQWRQPLNSLGIIIQNLQRKYDKGEVTPELMKKSTKKELELLDSMANTVSDFTNFFKPNKTKQVFYLSDAVKKALSILDSSLFNNNIDVELNSKDDCKCFAYENELVQALINIFQNSRDAIMQNKPEEKKIIITLSCRGSMASCMIEDSAGGIDNAIIGTIFKPYFTTKSDGTGIGLYMTKMILEDSLQGTISVKNGEKGACFNIMFPISRRFHGE
ncbi:MAG: sensor histidine kinase [Campylobacterales bacterium]